MGRTAIVNHLVDKTLKDCVAEKKFRFGLLIGQPNSDGRDYVVYAAPTPNHGSDDEENSEGAPQPPADNIGNVDPQLLVNHAVVATRMIPGSFYVQGIFVVSEKNVFQDDSAVKKLRQCVLDINKILSDNSIFRSNTAAYDEGEKLILHCPLQGQWSCRSCNTNQTSGSFKPADWKVLDKAVSWYLFETNYDIDEVFPIVQNEKDVSLEKNFLVTLNTLNTYLENSAIFIQHDQYEDNYLLENLLKVRRDKREQTDCFKTMVFFPTVISDSDTSQIVKVYGTIRYSGIVHSRIWVHPKTLLKDIKHYIRNDILRSLAARVQIYCDSLTEQSVEEGAFIVSEPPRRVFLKVAGAGGIEFCDYLFRGELPEIVVDQAKEMLALQISTADVEAEVEALPTYENDMSTVSEESMATSSMQMSRGEVRRNMYLAGILGAMAVLVVSLILHFVLR